MPDQVTSTWHLVAELDRLVEGDPLAVLVGGLQIALFRIGAEVYATDNMCTHEHALLSDGFVDGEVVECPLHQARFHIPTGRVLSPPAVSCLRSFPVRVDGNNVWVFA
jgi:naphthalene 1,2-dioxygenase system ferredoxin subunit